MDAYIYQADLHCKKCGEKFRKHIIETDETDALNWDDSDKYPQGPYPDGGGEADTPQHCGSCGLFLENPLTKDGEEYVNTAFQEYCLLGKGDKKVLAQWVDYYRTLEAQAKGWY